MDWLLFARLLLTSMSAFLVGTTLVISVTYFNAWRRRGVTTWRGLLPLHVFAVTLSYDLLLIYATIEITFRLADESPASWRLPLLAVAYVLGLVAMHTIFKFRQKHRLREDSNLPPST